MYFRLTADDDDDDDDDEAAAEAGDWAGISVWGTITRTLDSVLPVIASTDLLLTYTRYTRDTKTTLTCDTLRVRQNTHG